MVQSVVPGPGETVYAHGGGVFGVACVVGTLALLLAVEVRHRLLR